MSRKFTTVVTESEYPTGICRVCPRPIEHRRFQDRNWEPDFTEEDAYNDKAQWRHIDGYAGHFGQSGFAEPRPEVVVLCGSTRFYDAFQQANYDLTMQGKIVLSVGFYPHSKSEAGGHGEGVCHDSAEKVALDELHKRKIDMADKVFVLNVDGYIGKSTRSEIEYAEAHDTPVEYSEDTEAA